MSLQPWVWISVGCSRCGKESRVEKARADAKARYVAVSLVKYARKFGWITDRYGEWLCPNCQKVESEYVQKMTALGIPVSKFLYAGDPDAWKRQ